MSGRGRGRGRLSNQGGSSEGDVNNDGKKKKTKRRNPYFFNRGGFRGGFNRMNAPAHQPVTMHLPTTNVPERAENVGLSDTVVSETDRPHSELAVGCFGTENYPYFNFYFPNTEFDADSPLTSHIKAFERYFERNIKTFEVDFEEITQKRSFQINYDTLLEDTDFINDFKDFESVIKYTPDKTLAACGMAMHQVLRKILPTTEVDVEPFQPRLLDYKPIRTIVKAVNHLNIETLITVRGTVMRLLEVKYRDLWMCYVCKVCGAQQLVRQNNGKKVLPKSCKVKECRNMNKMKFEYQHNSPYRTYEPVQQVRIQESIHEKNGGNNMQYLNVLLKYDLVDKLSPGDDVVVTGILRVSSSHSHGVDQNNEYLEVVGVNQVNTGFTVRRLDFLDKDLQAIELIRTQPSVFRSMVNSLEPELYGLEMIKAGLVLSLFSGAPSSGNETIDYTSRENIHVLMVGDPGMGKSELLNACCNVAPKAIYSISSHLTEAGLIGTIKRTKGKVSVNVGSLVLAHGGVCCIDEIDKKSKIHSDLLDAMERQKVTIMQNGADVTLSCRTTIIAAGNPVGNLYKKSKTVAENLKINPALLTRFDLIFIIIKHEHMYPGEDRKHFQKQQVALDDRAKSLLGEKQFALQEFLRLSPDEQFDHIPPLLIQNYIGYARSHVFPRMTAAATNKIIEFYMELRRKQEMLDFFDITTRQFHALRRLCIARARVDLADEVTVEHVEDVIELTRYSLIDIFTTEEGQLESRGVQGSGMSKAKQKMRLLEEMRKYRDQNDQVTFHLDQIKKMKDYLKLTENVHDLVDSLNVQGILLMVKPNVYKIVN